MKLENILEQYKSYGVSSECTKQKWKWQIDLFGLERLCNACVVQQNEPYSKIFSGKTSRVSNYCDHNPKKKHASFRSLMWFLQEPVMGNNLLDISIQRKTSSVAFKTGQHRLSPKFLASKCHWKRNPKD